MLYQLLSVTTILLLSSNQMTYGMITEDEIGMIENKTGHTIILHSFSAHGNSLDITPKELPPYGTMNAAQINFTTCVATTLDGKQYQVIEIDLVQAASITKNSLLSADKTPEELQAFKKMISKLRRLNPLITNSNKRTRDTQSPITKLN